MLRDEIELAYRNTKCEWDICWIPRKYHNSPEKLREILQQTIDGKKNYSGFILTFCCCGGGTEGLYCMDGDIVLPDFEDCIHMLLFSKEKQCSLAEKGVIYLTNGWTKDEQSIVQQYHYTRKKYGAKTCSIIMQMMFGNFHELSVIDTGAYELSETLAYAQKAAESVGLVSSSCKGTIELLEQIFRGDFSNRCLVIPPGSCVKKENFNKQKEDSV